MASEWDLWIGLLYGVGGTLIVCLGLALINKYFRVEVLRMLKFGPFAIAKLDQDTAQYAFTIVRTTDTEYVMNGKAYRIYPNKFKMNGSVPEINHHHSSSEPINPRDYDAIVVQQLAEVEGVQEVEVEEQRDGKHYDRETKKMVEGPYMVKVKKEVPVKENRIVNEYVKKFWHVATPEELANYILGKQVYAEARAVILKMKMLEDLKTFLIITMIMVGVCGAGLYMIYNDQATMKTQMEQQVLPMLYHLNATVGAKANQTVIQLTNTGG